MPMLSRELIIKCQQGDRQAMGLLYTAMHDELLRLCVHYVGAGATAEDLLHDAFLLIFSKIGMLDHPERAQAWMHRVTRNVALLHLQQQHPNVSLDSMDESQLAAAAALPQPVSYDELLGLVDALPQGYRQVFRLSVLEGLSHRQIAALLDIEPHSSSSQLYRAKTLLRQSLRPLLVGLLALLLPTAAYLLLRRPSADTSLVAVGSVIPVAVPSPSSGHHAGAVPDSLSPLPRPSAPLSSPSVALPSGLPMADHAVREEENHPDIPDNQVQQPENHLSQADDAAPTLATADELWPAPNPVATTATASWTVELAYAGLGDGGGVPSLPQGFEGSNEADSASHHHLPLTVGLDVSHRIGPRLSLLGGVRYSLLTSDFTTGNTYLHADTRQRLHFLGFRLGLGYQLWHHARWSLQARGDATLDVPLHATRTTDYASAGQVFHTERTSPSPRPQWSAGVAAGLHYQLTPAVGFFVEPSLHYYFDNHDGLSHWRTEHRLSPELPLGIRVKF